MKFLEGKKYRPFSGAITEVVQYLTVDLQVFLSNLVIGLTKLQIDNNFNGWVEKDISIPAGEELSIINRLGESVKYRIILEGKDGSQNVTNGDTEWTAERVYLSNRGLIDVSGLTVVFLK